jgi:glycosyltransferase involved in cell wall biosynthesis
MYLQEKYHKSLSPTLCLNMIVKNESKIITRLFDSVSSIIDSYCICDTGSTDNTVSLITEYFKTKNIPGKVVIEPFKNFCHNRNVALQSCLGVNKSGEFDKKTEEALKIKTGKTSITKREIWALCDEFNRNN